MATTICSLGGRLHSAFQPLWDGKMRISFHAEKIVIDGDGGCGWQKQQAN